GMLPIGVVYELTFNGLQPAFHVKVTADWHMVYTHFSEMQGFTSIWHEDSVTKAIDDLVDKKVVKIEDTIEGAGDEGLQASHDDVLKDVRAYIFETFFKAPLDKATPAGAGAVDSVGRVLTSIVTAPFSIFGGKRTYQRKEMTDDELRTLDIDWS